MESFLLLFQAGHVLRIALCVTGFKFCTSCLEISVQIEIQGNAVNRQHGKDAAKSGNADVAAHGQYKVQRSFNNKNKREFPLYGPVIAGFAFSLVWFETDEVVEGGDSVPGPHSIT